MKIFFSFPFGMNFFFFKKKKKKKKKKNFLKKKINLFLKLKK